MVNIKPPHKRNFFEKIQTKRRQALLTIINQCERAKFHYRNSHDGHNPTNKELRALTGLSNLQILKVNRAMKQFARQDRKLDKIISKHTRKVK